MRRKHILAISAILTSAFLAAVFHGQLLRTMSGSPDETHSTGPTSLEQQVLALVNGSRAYADCLELENIAQNHLDFRSSGSSGANQTANLIKERFESFGLEAWLEPFQFTNWTLLDHASLIIDADGNSSTTDDQTAADSFQCEHYSWPTPSAGVSADLVVLPLPAVASYSQLGSQPIDTAAWNTVNTAGRVLLIGREARLNSGWHQTFKDKLSAQPPAAVVYTWWYSWMSFCPAFHSSAGGLPLGTSGSYLWDAHIPAGFVDYADGLQIRNMENANPAASANVTIRSAIGSGTHYNVVAKIIGQENPGKQVIVCGHYDSVMCSGFCDNAAGTAGVIEVARTVSQAVASGLYRPSCTVLFVAFAAEELGLVGSVHYVKQHKNEMVNITAVINLDCIGSDELYVTETSSDGGFDLDQTVVQAGQDLGVHVTLVSSSSSDQESFRNPSQQNGNILWNWDLDAGISDAAPIPSSAMIGSAPLLYYDLWNMGNAGWIHTPYDNSTTPNWVETSDLENHIKVAALTTLRVSPDAPIPEFSPSILLALLTSATLLAAVLAKRASHSQKQHPQLSQETCRNSGVLTVSSPAPELPDRLRGLSRLG